MKKLLTLAFAIATVASVEAQSTREEARRVILGQSTPSRTGDVVYDRNGNPVNNNSRRAEIDAVNREYDERIRAVRNNPNYTREEKERIISDLQRERQARIREINNRYGVGSDDRRNRTEGKRNGNGNKRGWEIGKGNPHRTGQWPGNSGNVNGKNRSDDRYDDDRYDDDRRDKKAYKSKAHKNKSKGGKGKKNK